MATAAARVPKRELAPDWRDALSASLRRFAVRSWGAVLFAVAAAGAVALATHSGTDPSLSTAAGGSPVNWLGTSGAYVSDALFWGALAVSLAIAFVAAFPVNYWLIVRGRGHAVVHAHHGQ